MIVCILRKWAQPTATNTDDIVVDAVQEPVRFLPVVLGVFFACEYMRPQGRFEVFTEHLVVSLITFTIFWALYRSVEPFRFLLRRLELVFSPIGGAVAGASYEDFILVGAATILETWGIKVAPGSVFSVSLLRFSAMTHRRIYWTIEVGKNTSFEQLYSMRDEIESYIIESEEVREHSSGAGYRAYHFVRR